MTEYLVKECKTYNSVLEPSAGDGRFPDVLENSIIKERTIHSMKKRELKPALYEVFDKEVEGMTFDEKINYIRKVFLEYQRDHEDQRDTSEKGKKWTDEQLKIILSDAPSKENCMKYAILFKRGYGSIEQIYRWSTTQDQELTDRRKEDSFIQQIKRVAKELGLRG